MVAVPVVDLQAAYGNSVQPQIVLDSTRNGVVIQDNPTPIGANLFQVNDSAGAPLFIVDPTSVRGSDASLGTLTLRGTSNANLGFIHLNSPVIFGPYTGNPGAAYGFDYSVTDNPVGAFIGGGLNFSGNITTGASTFIYESFRGAPTITTGANPGFAAYTVLQALPRLAAGSGAGHNPLTPLIVNAGAQIANPFSGTRTVTQVQGLNFGCQLRGEVSGAVLSASGWLGLNVFPAWHTVAGSTIDFGVIIGVDCKAPSVALFAQNNGTERMAAYYGLQMANPTISNSFGTAPVAAVRSSVLFGTNKYFLLNAGTAPSDMGAAHMYFNDNFGIAFGGAGVTNFDYWQSWNSAGYFRQYFFNTGQSLQWSMPTLHRYFFNSSSGNTNAEYTFNCHKFSIGANIGAVGNQVGLFTTNARTAGVPGGWADFLLTQGGNLNLGVFAMSDVSAWVINPISFDNTAASITELATLKMLMNTSAPGLTVTRRASLWNTGRIYQRGKMAYDSVNRDIAANQNDYSPATLNSDRQVLRLTAGSGAVNITGFALEAGQTEDTRYIVNADPTNNITLTHQDVLSVAANRIISPSGANYILGPDESCEIWYDATTARWRILWGTGA